MSENKRAFYDVTYDRPNCCGKKHCKISG